MRCLAVPDALIEHGDPDAQTRRARASTPRASRAPCASSSGGRPQLSASSSARRTRRGSSAVRPGNAGQLERELDATARAAALAAVAKSADPRAAFLAGCRAYLEFARRADFTRIGLVDAPSVLGAGGHALDTALGLPTILATVQGFMAIGRIERRPVKPIALLLFGALNEAAFALARREPDFDEALALDAIARILDGLAPRETGGAPASAPPAPPASPASRASAPARPAKRRLDERLVRDGLAETRAKAQALILRGRVLVDERRARQARHARCATPTRVELRAAPPSASSRAAARSSPARSPTSASIPRASVCLDVGASTGGFTDCLLQRGARRVVAVDVGHGQLDVAPPLDPRVAVLERSNARTLPAEPCARLPARRSSSSTMDVSFISAALLLPALARGRAARPSSLRAREAAVRGRPRAGGEGRRGARRRAPRGAAAGACARPPRGSATSARGEADSRLAGPKGNREIFLASAAARDDE